MVSQTGPRVVRFNSCKGSAYPGKRPKKSQRAKQKFLGQQVLFGTNFLKFGLWPQKGQPGNPGCHVFGQQQRRADCHILRSRSSPEFLKLSPSPAIVQNNLRYYQSKSNYSPNNSQNTAF